MFVLRAKVVIEDDSTRQAAFGVAGEQAAERLSALGLAVPAAVGAMEATGAVRVLRRAGARPRYSLHGSAAALAPLRDALAAGSREVGPGAWQLLDILAGQPSIAPQTQDHFVAQMLNLDTLGGISFDKGCYTGQEVIARLHYLGQLKRRMFLCRVERDEVPPPGTSIHLAEGDSQAVGEVVAAQRHPEGGCVLLAVLQLAHAESDRLRLGSTEGAVIARPQSLV
jgi:folate-binding protein YgfZ